MVNEEKDALLASLNAQREHVLGALDGLSEADLRRPVRQLRPGRNRNHHRKSLGIW